MNKSEIEEQREMDRIREGHIGIILDDVPTKKRRLIGPGEDNLILQEEDFEEARSLKPPKQL